MRGWTLWLCAPAIVAALACAALREAAAQTPRSDHNPQGDPDVERGWQDSQDAHARQQDDHDRSETDAGHSPCPDDGVCSDQSTYKNRGEAPP